MALRHIVSALAQGDRNFSQLEQAAQQQLLLRGWQPDYIAIRRQADLQLPQDDDALVVLGAARLGKTRLIDNIEVPS